MSAQHTPAPWTAFGWSIKHSNGHRICAVGQADKSLSRFGTADFDEMQDECRANLRLIAAAPDLLALAHLYASECSECGGTGMCDKVVHDSAFIRARCPDCADIRDVIAKAAP